MIFVRLRFCKNHIRILKTYDCQIVNRGHIVFKPFSMPGVDPRMDGNLISLEREREEGREGETERHREREG